MMFEDCEVDHNQLMGVGSGGLTPLQNNLETEAKLCKNLSCMLRWLSVKYTSRGPVMKL